MKMKIDKKMRGFTFTCHSPAATAVCMSTGDPTSVIVPRRADRTFIEHARLIKDATSYRQLTEFRKPSGAVHRRSSLSLAPVDRGHGHEPQRKPCHLPLSLTSSSNHVFQVVVMRVSLHCQGCAGKVKKHLSKMEGVTSFSIDLEAKRVTVMGNVSPLGVLESISKVKKAEFWPCT